VRRRPKLGGWPSRRPDKPHPAGYELNPGFLEKPGHQHGGFVRTLTQHINGRPVVTDVVHVGPDLHELVPPGEWCRCGKYQAPS
jgi:hypothetical protein